MVSRQEIMRKQYFTFCHVCPGRCSRKMTVEDGKIVAPIENMRFDDSIYHFLGDNLEALTTETAVNPDVGTYDGRELNATICPGILLKSFSLTL